MDPKTRALLVTVSAVVLVEAVFFSAIAPLLPHYAASLHLSKTGAGVLVGAYTSGSFVGALPAGLLATRIGVKQTLSAGLVILGVCSALFGLVHPIWLLVLVRVGQGVGAALSWTGALAWLVAVTPQAQRGELIGRALGVAAAGGLVGPGLGAIASSVGIRPTFLVVGLSTLLLAAWTMRLPGAPPGARHPARALFTSVLRPGVAGGLWLMAIPSMMVGVVGVLAPLRLGHLGFGAGLIGGVFIVAAVVEAGATVASGRWADRHGRTATLLVSLVAVIVFCAILPLPRTGWLLAAVVILAGVSYGAFFVPAMALLTDIVEALGIDPAFGFALLMAAWAPGQLLGSAGGGALASAAGDGAPYLVLAVLSATTFTILVRRRGSDARRRIAADVGS